MRAVVAGVWLLVVLQVPACATDLVREDGRLVFRSLGFAIDDPGAGPQAGWSAHRVEGALLSFRAPDGATLSLVQKCGPLPGDLQILARELLIGLEERQIEEEAAVTVNGAPGWRIVARVAYEGRAVRLHTVTRRLGECSLDWIAVAPLERVGLGAEFDAWWASFRAAPAAEAAGPGDAAPGAAAGPGKGTP